MPKANDNLSNRRGNSLLSLSKISTNLTATTLANQLQVNPTKIMLNEDGKRFRTEEDLDLGELSLLANSLLRLPSHILNELFNLVLESSHEISTQAVVNLLLLPNLNSINLIKYDSILINGLSKCTLTSLNLSQSDRIDSNLLNNLFKNQFHLQNVNLKNLLNLNDNHIMTLTNHNKLTLSIVNINNTKNLTFKSLAYIIGNCSELTTLKIAKMSNLTNKILDKTFQLAISLATNHIPLSKLTTLKLRSTLIDEISLGRFLNFNNTLISLDISFTEVKSLDHLNLLLQSSTWSLQKLVLSGLPLSATTINNLLNIAIDSAGRTSLVKFKLERMPHVSSTKSGLSDETLLKLLPSLQKLNLQEISFLGNKELGKNKSQPLGDFITTVGSRCKKLNLTSIPVQLKHLDGLLEIESSNLECLIINSTLMDDRSIPALSTLKNLQELHIAGSKITIEGLRELMKNVPNLRSLDLNSCRGVPTLLRRGFFSEWERELEVKE